MDNSPYPGGVLLRSDAGARPSEIVLAPGQATPSSDRGVDSRQVDLRCRNDSVRRLELAYDPKKNNFGFIRFVLATAVIWSHSYALSGRSEPFSALSGQTDAGSVAVDGFFVLSGFLVTQSWLQQPAVRAFAIKRFLRLAPALLLATLFGAFVIGALGTTVPFAEYVSTPGPWLHFLGVLLNRYLFIPGIFLNNPDPTLLNTPLWSLRFEILCYALVGALGALGGRQLGKAAVAVFVISWLAYLCLPASISPLSILFKALRLLACFSAGMILYIFRRQVPFGWRWALLAAATLGLTFFTSGFRSALPWAGGYLLIYLACLASLPLHNFCRYGDFSYGLYIFACPIQQLLLSYLGKQIPVSVLFGSAFLFTLAIAALSWHLVEAPALALKPNRVRVVVCDTASTDVRAGQRLRAPDL